MTPAADIWTRRLLLLGLGLLSLAIPFMHYRFLESPIEGYHVGGPYGLHPADLLSLRDLGSFSRYPPGIILLALVTSFFRPFLTRFLLILCTASFVIYITVYLFQCLMSIALHIAPAPA
jgi:hypothetical protein